MGCEYTTKGKRWSIAIIIWLIISICLIIGALMLFSIESQNFPNINFGNLLLSYIIFAVGCFSLMIGSVLILSSTHFDWYVWKEG